MSRFRRNVWKQLKRRGVVGRPVKVFINDNKHYKELFDSKLRNHYEVPAIKFKDCDL